MVSFLKLVCNHVIVHKVKRESYNLEIYCNTAKLTQNKDRL